MKNKIELFKNEHPSTSFLVGDNLTFNKAMDSLLDNRMDGLPCDMVKVAPVWNPLTLISRMEIYLKSKTESSGGDVITQPLVNVPNLPIEMLDLPIRALNCLKNHKINTLVDLVQTDRNKLIKFRNLGVKTLSDIENVLNVYTYVSTTTPKVFLMSAGNKYVNIKLGYKERIWGSNYSKGTIKSHQNVNEGDIIIVYCSDKENNLQGFHMIGKVKFCAPPDYIDKTTWLEPYGHIVHVDWLNEPNKENFFKLSDVYEYVKYQEWGVYLRDGKYQDASNVGWSIDSQLLKDILNKLTNY